MNNFFHGWRRRAGCVTLVMACVFMAGWVRSFKTADLVGLYSDTTYCATSNAGEFRLEISTPYLKGIYLDRMPPISNIPERQSRLFSTQLRHRSVCSGNPLP